ncbi:MAG: hypothetical protein ACREQ9_07620 [Candidatus Binatia bacterium]
MALAAVYRSLLLAPFGGEEALIRAARSRLHASRLYSGAQALSIEEPTEAELAVALSLAFADGDDRSRRLASVVARLGPGDALIVIDHNAPRRRAPRLLATAYVALGWPLSKSPAPGRRLRHPVARELQGLGLEVLALRLLGSEFF